jgi:hypothetical protein
MPDATLSRPRVLRSLVAATLLGAVAGALFGIGFGALASVFHDGPALWTGVQESWGFFAVLGGAMGLSWAWAHRPSHDAT